MKMQIEIYVILAAVLIGIGVGSALSRRNIISVVMAVATAGAGTLIAMATVGRESEAQQNDGMLFALVLGAVILVTIVLGCALAYRRYVSAKVTDVGAGNRLRY
jgi:NADH:ubiquinone oxidoreductase subunit K